MKAYVFQAALICPECAMRTRKILATVGVNPSENSDHWPQGPYADGGGESDSPAHCDHCEVFLENPLTADGMAYVVAALAERDPTERTLAQTVWAPFYGIA